MWGAFAALVLLVPLVAMQFSDEVIWTSVDFVMMGVLLFGAGAAYEIASTRSGATAYRAAFGVAIAAALVLVWVNGAVGLVAGKGDDANLILGAVPVVGFVGAIVARLQPAGMARALLAMALTQALVAAIALGAGWGSDGPAWPRGVLIATAFFSVLWLTSARLFRAAAREQLLHGRSAIA